MHTRFLHCERESRERSRLFRSHLDVFPRQCASCPDHQKRALLDYHSLHSLKRTKTCSFTSWRREREPGRQDVNIRVIFDGSRYGYTRQEDLLGREEVLQLATAVLGLEVGAACACPNPRRSQSAKRLRRRGANLATERNRVPENAPPMNSPLMKIEGTVDWPVFWARYACRRGFG